MTLKKCIVVDLDNTLWGGIVGEDGMDRLQLSLKEPGASFIAFQQVLKDYYDRGVILAVNSRNNFEDAMHVIRNHPNMILRENNFAAIRINWQDKSLNLIELAKEMNIGLDAIVFLDDDPTNRMLVKSILPDVEVPDMPISPRDYAKFLIDISHLFPATAITDEDKMRGNLYVTERLRLEAEKSFDNREEFLNNLDLELQVFVDDLSSLARLSQLTEKTNQFNINKKELTEEALSSLINSPSYKIIHGRLTDRFGDHGIVNLAIVKIDEDIWHIEQFLMSCRVIGRGVEDAFLKAIGQMCDIDKVKLMSVNFQQSQKNKPAEDFIIKHFKNNLISVADISNQSSWINIKYGKI